jgi:hypothetical protein
MQDTRENLNHSIYEIFPTVIYRGEIKCHQEFKEKYLKELCKYWHWAPELPRDTFTSPENSGRYFLHHKEQYQDFFKCVIDNVRQYLRVLAVDESKLNVYITKSWLNIHEEDSPEIKIHNHNCSDISFCYYLQCNETSDKLCFHNKENINEVSGFMFQTTANPENNLITVYNKYNCDKYTVSPIEGTIILFPSSMLHSTLNTMHRTINRIGIAGDITLTLKEGNEKSEFSRIDPSTWRKF